MLNDLGEVRYHKVTRYPDWQEFKAGQLLAPCLSYNIEANQLLWVGSLLQHRNKTNPWQ